jgi:hypothetical protein
MPKKKSAAMPMAIAAADTVKKPRGRYWMGSTPIRCEICQRSFGDTFIDGATSRGPWYLMHPACHDLFGRGLGTGLGQQYAKQADGRWLKVGG